MENLPEPNESENFNCSYKWHENPNGKGNIERRMQAALPLTTKSTGSLKLKRSDIILKGNMKIKDHAHDIVQSMVSIYNKKMEHMVLKMLWPSLTSIFLARPFKIASLRSNVLPIIYK